MKQSHAKMYPHAIYPHAIYPWHMLPSWCVNAESQPSEIVRRPSFTRGRSFSISDTNGLNRDLATIQEEHLCYSSDGDEVDHAKSSSDTSSAPKNYPTERQNKVLPELEAQDQYLEKKFGYHRFLIIPDGNCLYRAFAQALVHDQSKYMVLRTEVVHHIQEHIDEFKDIIEGDAWEFLKDVSRDSTWASYPEILAITQMLDINVMIVTGGSETNSKVFTTLHHFRRDGKPIEAKDTVWLSWLSNGHYDLIVDCKMKNVHYKKWVKEVKSRLDKDEKLAKKIAHEESGMGISGITNSIKNLMSHMTGASCSSSEPTDANQQKLDTAHAQALKHDEALARSLQKEEERCAFETEFGDQYA